MADTCVAVDDWLQNPSANAPLSLQFLPCMDNETAQATLKATKQTSFYVINVVNKFIIEASNRDVPPDAGILYVNQSGPPVPLLCNPYYPDLTERDCSHAEVNFGNVAQVSQFNPPLKYLFCFKFLATKWPLFHIGMEKTCVRSFR